MVKTFMSSTNGNTTVVAQCAVKPCHKQESMYSTYGSDAWNNTNNRHNKTAALAEKLSVYDRVIVDTSFLLHEGFQSFLEKYGKDLLDAGVRFSLRIRVKKELEKRIINPEKPEVSEAAKYVLSLLEEWTYGSLFIMETDKPVHDGLADFDLCHSAAKDYNGFSQLLLANDADLIRSFYNFFPSVDGKEDVVTHVLALGDDGELGQFDFRERYAQEILPDWPIFIKPRRDGVRPKKPKHQCQIEAEDARQKVREASQQAYEQGAEANFRFVSEAQELVMDKSALWQLKNSPCLGNFFAELLTSGFIASDKRIWVSEASINGSATLRHFVKNHSQLFRVEPAAPGVSEETALVHLIYLRIDTYSLKSVRLITQSSYRMRKVLGRRPKCYETGLVQACTLRSDCTFGETYRNPKHSQMSAC